MKMIEPIQVQLIHIAKTQLGLSREEYEAAIMAQTKGKKSSSKDLTYFEADGLINYFRTLGFKIQSNYIKTSGAARRSRWAYANAARRARKNPGNVVLMPSRDQMEMIKVLVKKIPWRLEDGYRRWLEKNMKITRIKTAGQASDVIEGLKGLMKTQLQET
ncbi:MAG TPA: DUF1018 domain-containing protein [Syntrophales bacterium]|nr:DUF1018 domain-containing protein [Syntrophales bacterium]